MNILRIVPLNDRAELERTLGLEALQLHHSLASLSFIFQIETENYGPQL